MREFTFDHERMPVYRLAVELYGEVVMVAAGLRWPARWAGDQLLRAVGSVVLNIAEGAAEHSAAEKARFYRMALRSAGEAAAALDLLQLHAAASGPSLAASKQKCGETARMLTALTISTSRRGRQ
jgi:four helix bundle protein